MTMAIVLACDHSSASPNTPTPPAPADKERPVGDEHQIHKARADKGTVGDERQLRAVDARALPTTHAQGKLTFAIGLPKEVGPGLVHSDWVGEFTVDGKEIPGTKFKLTVVRGWMVTAEIAGDALPSSTVRLYPPGYRDKN